jgi:hypothetical protein
MPPDLSPQLSAARRISPEMATREPDLVCHGAWARPRLFRGSKGVLACGWDVACTGFRPAAHALRVSDSWRCGSGPTAKGGWTAIGTAPISLPSDAAGLFEAQGDLRRSKCCFCSLSAV